MISASQSYAYEMLSEHGPLVSKDRAWAEDLELQARLEAQAELLPFCHYVSPWFQSPAHIRHLAPYYERIDRGEIDRLMVLMPPRHGKTNLGLHFLAWYIARNPRDELVLASYNDIIAGLFSSRIRGLIEQPQFAMLLDAAAGFTARTDPEFRGKELWKTVEGGMMRAAGMKGGTSGFGGCGIYIDDFLKGRKDADSPTIRETIDHTYSGELYPRLMPRANGKGPWVVMTYTPWHPVDLGMQEIQAMLDGTGDNWTVVRLPAVAEANDPIGRPIGAALWPERYNLEHLARIKRVQDRKNPRDWNALFQCRPADLEGSYYKLPMLPDIIRDKPGQVSCLIVSDLAASGDETAHGVVEIDSHSDCQWVNVWHESCDTLIAADAMLDLVAGVRSSGKRLSGWVHAKGLLDRGVKPLYQLRARDRNIPLPPEFEYHENADKLALSSSAQGYCLAGRMRFDHRGIWWPWMRDQCLAFTGAEGAKDEGPDLLKLLGMHLDKVIAPPQVAPRASTSKAWDPWNR